MGAVQSTDAGKERTFLAKMLDPAGVMCEVDTPKPLALEQDEECEMVLQGRFLLDEDDAESDDASCDYTGVVDALMSTKRLSQIMAKDMAQRVKTDITAKVDSISAPSSPSLPRSSPNSPNVPTRNAKWAESAVFQGCAPEAGNARLETHRDHRGVKLMIAFLSAPGQVYAQRTRVMKGQRLILFDISGTLHVGQHVVGNGPAALERLRQAGCKLRFVSNTSKESRSDLVRRLQGLGYDIRDAEVFTPLTAVRSLIEKERLRPLLLLSDSARTDVGIETSGPYDAVVVGLAPERLNYEWMNKAFRVLDAGGKLIAAHMGLYLREEDGMSLGPGAFVRALEFSAGKQAVVLGKPSPGFFSVAAEAAGVGLDQAVMIGDDAVSDCAGALQAGVGGALLVRTGKYRPGDETRADLPPTALVADVVEAADWVLQHPLR